MVRFMSGSRFAFKAGLRVAIFLALTLCFPFVVYGLILATNARSVGGASGALAVVAGIYLKPIIVLGFLISLIAPCWVRMRSLGLPAFWGFLVPFLFLMDAAYLMVVGTHWGVAFSLGIVKLNAPLFAMTAVATLTAMTLVFPSFDRDSSGRGFGLAGRICGALAILLVVVALLTAGRGLWLMAWLMLKSPGGQLGPPLLLPAKLGYWAALLKPFVCFGFCVALAVVTALSRRGGDATPPGADETATTPASRSLQSTLPGSSPAVFRKR